MDTSCIRANNSHEETKYLINKDLFLYMKFRALLHIKCLVHEAMTF
jgi:hypothetical protein